MGSATSSSGRRDRCDRSAARSSRSVAPSSVTRRDASTKVYVLCSFCGAISSTVSRCDRVIVMTRSAVPAIRALNCRAEKSEQSPLKLRSTRAACGCIGFPSTARVPALDAVNSASLRCAANAQVKRSAVGERQMFPVQTNRICSSEPLFSRRSRYPAATPWVNVTDGRSPGKASHHQYLRGPPQLPSSRTRSIDLGGASCPRI